MIYQISLLAGNELIQPCTKLIQNYCMIKKNRFEYFPHRHHEEVIYADT